MDWRDYIHQDPLICGGKPVLKGTRLSVELILERLADGWTQEMMLDNYPTLEPIHLQVIQIFNASYAGTA